MQDIVEWEWHILLFWNFGKSSEAVKGVRGEKDFQHTNERAEHNPTGFAARGYPVQPPSLPQPK